MSEALAVANEHASRLIDVRGVVGVMLGGSQARGTASPGSDVDLGVYYRSTLDVARLQDLASALAGRPTTVAAPGGWGPWVDGGAWLDIGDQRVDWILRDVDRARAECDRARSGTFSVHHQVGHPFGFLSTAYAAEIALGISVADPTGELALLAERTRPYPAPLTAAFAGWLQEAGFSIDIARKAVRRDDGAYISMCVTHAVGIMAHALHGRAGAWVTVEKGLIGAAGRLPGAPEDFTERAHALCTGVLDGAVAFPDQQARLDAAAALLADVRTAVGH